MISDKKKIIAKHQFKSNPLKYLSVLNVKKFVLCFGSKVKIISIVRIVVIILWNCKCDKFILRLIIGQINIQKG